MTSCFTLFQIFLPPFCSSCKISCSRNILRLYVHSTSSGCARKGCVAARNLFLLCTTTQHRPWPQQQTAVRTKGGGQLSVGSCAFSVFDWRLLIHERLDRLAQRSVPTDSSPNPEERTLRVHSWDGGSGER